MAAMSHEKKSMISPAKIVTSVLRWGFPATGVWIPSGDDLGGYDLLGIMRDIMGLFFNGDMKWDINWEYSLLWYNPAKIRIWYLGVKSKWGMCQTYGNCSSSENGDCTSTWGTPFADKRIFGFQVTYKMMMCCWHIILTTVFQIWQQTLSSMAVVSTKFGMQYAPTSGMMCFIAHFLWLNNWWNTSSSPCVITNIVCY